MNVARVAELKARHCANGRFSDSETTELLRHAVQTADMLVTCVQPKLGDLYLIRTNDPAIYDDLAAGPGNPFSPARVLVVRSDIDLAQLHDHELVAMGLQRIPGLEGHDLEKAPG